MDYIQGKIIPEYAHHSNRHHLNGENLIPVPIPITATVNKLYFYPFHIRRDVSNFTQFKTGEDDMCNTVPLYR